MDSFRHFYPDLEGAYSWWSYMLHSRQNNNRWRIDNFLADERQLPPPSDSRLLSPGSGSDD